MVYDIRPYLEQPRARMMQHVTIGEPGHETTCIVRFWSRDDARRCTRCPKCAATAPADSPLVVCTVAVPGRVEPADGFDYEIAPPAGFRRVRDN